MPALTAHPIAKTRRHLKRYRQIADILVHNGFGNLADQLGLPTGARRFLPGVHGVRAASVAERARIAIEELGPTFIKFGQLLSTRPDILPDEFIAELEKLQDELPPISYEEAVKVVAEELGAPVARLFKSFDRKPLAAASIAQVHRATLAGGEKVVVKIRRPGIVEQITTDTEVLTDLAALAERRTTWGRKYGVTELVGEFARTLEEQLDFTLEAGYAARFRERLPKDGFDVPAICWDLTGERVLTMTYFDTIKISRVDELKRAGYDLKLLARELLDYVLRQALLDGMFHGDLHPGNIGVEADGTIVFMDFGLVGFLDTELRRQVGDLIVGLVEGQEQAVAIALMDIGRVRDRSGLDELTTEADRLLRRYYEQSLSRLSVGEVLLDAVRLVGKYGARVPGEAALFVKTLVSIEGLCLRLDPELKVHEIARPVARRLMEERYSPERIAALIRKNAHTAARLVMNMPERVERLVEKAESGAFRITVDLPETEQLEARLDVVVNRIIVGILVAAILVASSLMFLSGLGPTWQGIPLLGVGGFITGFAVGARLFLAILRSGNI